MPMLHLSNMQSNQRKESLEVHVPQPSTGIAHGFDVWSSKVPKAMCWHPAHCGSQVDLENGCPRKIEMKQQKSEDVQDCQRKMYLRITAKRSFKLGHPRCKKITCANRIKHIGHRYVWEEVRCAQNPACSTDCCGETLAVADYAIVSGWCHFQTLHQLCSWSGWLMFWWFSQCHWACRAGCVNCTGASASRVYFQDWYCIPFRFHILKS